MEGKNIVLVWRCIEGGSIKNCFGLRMYREWKEKVFYFGDVHRVDVIRIFLVWGCTEIGRNKCVFDLVMYSEWNEIVLCCFEDVQKVEGNRIVLV
jgi:hypothetical protein